MKTIFKKGDKVYCLLFGCGIVTSVSNNDDKDDYPILVNFKNRGDESYTKDGKYYEHSCTPMLYYYKPEIIAPKWPDMSVDTLLRVWDYEKESSSIRYFSHWNSDGRVCCFTDGATSLSSNVGSTVTWKYYEVYTHETENCC